MRRTFVALILLVALGAPPAAAQPSLTSTDVSVDPSGHFELRRHAPDWTFGGDVGRPVTNITEANGQDALGAFHQVDFDEAVRSSAIRVYQDLGVVLFTTTYRSDSPNGDPFPKLTVDLVVDRSLVAIAIWRVLTCHGQRGNGGYAL